MEEKVDKFLILKKKLRNVLKVVFDVARTA